MTPSPTQKRSAAAAFFAATAAIIGGTLVTTSSNEGQHVCVPWEGQAPAQRECMELTGYASPQLLAAWKMQSDAGHRYTHLIQCWPAGMDAGVTDIVGVVPLAATERMVDAGATCKAEAWLGAFPCACSTGSDCRHLDGGAAILGNTLAEGTFEGEGCHRKACVELAGVTSWPAECPAQ